MTYRPDAALAYVVLAYLCGAIPFGVLIGRMRGVDPRSVGIGNIGATNVLRALGPVTATLVLLLDLSKGFLPVWFVSNVPTHPATSMGAGWAEFVIVCTAVAAMVGHNWSIFLKGKGGKGASTGFGVVLALDWRVAVLIATVFVLVVLITRYVSLGSTLGAWCVPLGLWWWHRGTTETSPLVAFGLMAALLITFKHRANYRRLLNGTESKFGRRPPTSVGG